MLISKRPTGLFFLVNMKKQIKNILITITIIVIMLILWELLITHFHIPKRIAPKPSNLIDFIQKEFFTSHSTKYQTILTKSLYSLKDALIGFTLALIIGSGLGILLSQNKIIYSLLFPFLFLTQLIPIPALAPVLAAILGYGYSTKILLVVLFTIFPIIITMRNTILNIPENYKQLLHTYTQKPTILFKYLILPSLVPPLLSIMKIICSASIVATIITELPLSVKGGIGKDIYNSFNNQIIARVWVSVILISLISLIFFNLLSYLEKYINTKYKYGKF